MKREREKEARLPNKMNLSHIPACGDDGRQLSTTKLQHSRAPTCLRVVSQTQDASTNQLNVCTYIVDSPASPQSRRTEAKRNEKNQKTAKKNKQHSHGSFDWIECAGHKAVSYTVRGGHNPTKRRRPVDAALQTPETTFSHTTVDELLRLYLPN